MTFDEVYDNYFCRIYSYIRKRVGHQQDSEDLTAEVFVTAYKHWGSYDAERCPVLAWLFVIASSRLKNYYRDRKVLMSIDQPEITNTVPSEEYCDQAIILMEQRKQLNSLLQQLPERERTIVVSKYLYGMTNQEMATAMNLSAVNVRVICTRALQKMRTRLTGDGK